MSAVLKIHVNPETGETGKCTATVKGCKYAKNGVIPQHYNNDVDARQAYEKTMKSHTISQPLVKTSKKHVNNADEINNNIKTMNSQGLAKNILKILRENNVSEAEMKEYKDAMLLAKKLHEGQTRRTRVQYINTPYVEHPLRVSLRLLKYGVKDNSVIKAAILHDTVEDGAQRFAKNYKNKDNLSELEARKELLDHIDKNFGEDTRNIVLSVTNDHVDGAVKSKMTKAEKNKMYYDHLKANIEDKPQAMLVKISDFIDNAGSIHKTVGPGNEKATMKTATKYAPCVELFENELTKDNPYINKETRELLQTRMKAIRFNLNKVIEEYKEFA